MFFDDHDYCLVCGLHEVACWCRPAEAGDITCAGECTDDVKEKR